MSDGSKIEWTDASWNPVRGCTKVSPGCKRCYAERFAERFRGVKGHPYERGFDPRFVPEQLKVPLHWRKPRRVFVDSMSDLFHEKVTDHQIADVCSIMAACPQHTFQVLTKRAERMQKLFTRMVTDRVTKWGTSAGERLPDIEWMKQELFVLDVLRSGLSAGSRPLEWPLPNVWLGVSVESGRYTDRIDWLRATPAAVRVVSFEPLLSSVAGVDLSGVDLVICGCESGPKARPMDLSWARELRDRCVASGIPFFLKQAVIEGRLGKMPELDGHVWAQMPEVRA